MQLILLFQSCPAPLPARSPQALCSFIRGEIFHLLLGGVRVRVVIRGQFAWLVIKGQFAWLLDFQAYTSTLAAVLLQVLASVTQISPPHTPLQAQLRISVTLWDLLPPSSHFPTSKNLLESVICCCPPPGLCSHGPLSVLFPGCHYIRILG